MTIWTVQPSGGDYTTLASACSNASTVDGDIIEISGDWSTRDSTRVDVNDAITIRTKSGDQAEHAGFDNGTTNYALVIANPATDLMDTSSGETGDVTIEGLIFRITAPSTSDQCLTIKHTGNFTGRRCIFIIETNTDQCDCVFMSTNTSATRSFEQCIFIGANRGGMNIQNVDNTTYDVNSCTFWNCGHKVHTDNPGGGITVSSGAFDANNNTINVQNCLFLDCDNATANGGIAEGAGSFTTAPVWNVSNSITTDARFTAVGLDAGSGNTESATLKEEGDAPGAGTEVWVKDITTLPYDLRLFDDETNNDAQTHHSNDTAHGLTIPSTDIAGNARSAPHDVGAHHASVAAAAMAMARRYQGLSAAH